MTEKDIEVKIAEQGKEIGSLKHRMNEVEDVVNVVHQLAQEMVGLTKGGWIYEPDPCAVDRKSDASGADSSQTMGWSNDSTDWSRDRGCGSNVFVKRRLKNEED